MEVGCVMDEHKIYKVNKIVVLPLSDAEPQELDLDVRILYIQCCKWMILFVDQCNAWYEQWCFFFSLDLFLGLWKKNSSFQF